MKLWIVQVEEFNGWECEGHWMPYLVAASTKEDALKLLPPGDNPSTATEFRCPDVSRWKKDRIIPWESPAKPGNTRTEGE